MNRVKFLHHGTTMDYAIDIFENGVDLSKGKAYVDFGPGFYTTPNKKFGIRNATRATLTYNNIKSPEVKATQRVVAFAYCSEKIQGLNIKRFTSADEEWARFIIANRSKNPEIYHNLDNNRDRKYDIVVGPTADGSGILNNLVRMVDSGELLLENVDYKMFAPPNTTWWGKQISFHTDKSLTCIEVVPMI